MDPNIAEQDPTTTAATGNQTRRVEKPTSPFRSRSDLVHQGEEPGAPMQNISEDTVAAAAHTAGQHPIQPFTRFPATAHPSPPPDLYQEQRARKAIRQHSKLGNKPTTSAAWLAAIRATLAPHLHAIGILPANLSVELFRSGGGHVLYTVRDATLPASAPEYLFRISSNAATAGVPWYKTEAEVAVMELVARATTVPVPRVHAYDSGSANAVGREWVLMGKVGRGEGECETYARREATLTKEQKVGVARRVAEWRHELSTVRFAGLGGVYRKVKERKEEEEEEEAKDILSDYYVGPTVDDAWTHDWRLTYTHLPRGPFGSTRAYLEAHLAFARHEILHDARQRAWARLDELKWEFKALDNLKALEALPFREAAALTAGQERQRRLSLRAQGATLFEDRDGALGVKGDVVDWKGEPTYWCREGVVDGFADGLAACEDVQGVVDKVCSAMEEKGEVFFLDHHDMTGNNVLVGADGKAVALIDWENVRASPAELVLPVPWLLLSAEDEEEEMLVSAYWDRLEELGSVLLGAGEPDRVWDAWELCIEAGESEEWYMEEVREMQADLEEQRTRGRSRVRQMRH